MKCLLTLIAALAISSPILADSTVANLRSGTPCCWETQFRQGDVGCGPCGPTRGTVLYADGKHPRLTARMQGVVWKGKQFHGDGSFTNRWLGGIRAGSACIHVEPSWLDGQPCLVIQYEPNALVFGNVRDELRQIGPDTWLGRSYDSFTGQPKNWFLLQAR